MADTWTIDARSFDWIDIVLHTINEQARKDGRKPGDVTLDVGYTKDGAILKIPKIALPAPVLAKMLGTTVEKLEAAKDIRLNPLKQDGWEKPTVDYSGWA